MAFGAASRFRGPAALCLTVALAAGLAGCRPRTVADHDIPAAPPPAGSTAPTMAVGQQDVDNLNGILSSVGGAVTSVRSALAGDSTAPKG